MVGIITIDSLFLDIYRTRPPSISRHARHLFLKLVENDLSKIPNLCRIIFIFYIFDKTITLIKNITRLRIYEVRMEIEDI